MDAIGVCGGISFDLVRLVDGMAREGAGCDGPVLVAHDILGLPQENKPNFSMSFSQLGQTAVDACGRH